MYGNGRIEKIVKNNEKDFYEVSLHVISYTGAMNPPYKLVKMTLHVPESADSESDKGLHYFSEKISSKQFDKLSQFTSD
ncbi:hypothetical protein NIE88_19835 [Sporolactobacillus shoreicorticis]|uniref:Uncharacterized protein n=1 Tax=Sporolactobacillus shoreicorticis TaxID=1923877 RepID=A0ABW5S3X1_9BACL|nr:hypothetical protein [Sporolactobacillus shoreicorticis]MCO7127996.1 hypothetical protein [Sporolactobacillus shoreicorticis]